MSEIRWSPAPGNESRAMRLSDELPLARPIKAREGREVLALGDVVAKRYLNAGLAKRVWVALFGGKGRREWRLSLEARRRGIPVPDPIAYGSREAEEWLVMARIPGATDLATIARDSELGRTVPPSAKKPSIERLARLLRRCHEAGLRHDDLHPGNVLAAGDELHLIDLDGARLGRPLDRADLRDRG